MYSDCVLYVIDARWRRAKESKNTEKTKQKHWKTECQIRRQQCACIHEHSARHTQPKWDESVSYDVCQDQHRFWKISLNCKYFLNFLPLFFFFFFVAFVRTLLTRIHSNAHERKVQEIPSLSAILKFCFWRTATTTLKTKHTPILRYHT